MLPFLTGFPTVMSFDFWNEPPSGANQLTVGMVPRFWTTWTVQVRVYGRPANAKVEGVNWTFGRGRAVGEAMQKVRYISHALDNVHYGAEVKSYLQHSGRKNHCWKHF